MQFIFAVVWTILFLVLNEGARLSFLSAAGLSFGITLVMLGIATAVISATAEKSAAHEQQERESRELQAIREHFVDFPDHVHVLKRIHDRCVYEDEFGDVQLEDWRRKVGDYAEEKMFVDLSGPERELFASKVSRVLLELWDATESSGDHLIETKGVPTRLDGARYERECLALLSAQGFVTELTAGTGDQGADLIAAKGRYRLAIQCKNYGNAVGNAAIQQVEAARQFYDCTHGVVVSDAGFTRSARQLAGKVGVTLLRTDQLSRLRKSMLQSRPSA